jgi:uncharacterized repeat protein (TIGR01451 family)
MPIRRSLLAAFGLVLFGSAFVAGQQSDPFADWDRRNTRTGSTQAKSASKSPKTTVEWFSPNAGAEPKTANAESEVTQVPMRERVATPSKSSESPPTKTTVPAAGARTEAAKAPASKPPAVTSAKPLPTEKSKPTETAAAKVSTSTTGKSSPTSAKVAPATTSATTKPVAKPTVEKNSGSKSTAAVKPATFDGTKVSKAGAIRKVSGQADEANPFEEFLNATSTEEAENSGPSLENIGRDFGGEDEKAEPVVVRKPSDATTSKSAATKASSAAPVASEDMMPVRPASSASKTPIQTASSPSPADAGPQSPGVTVQWKQLGAMNVGQECELELIVQNSSRAVVRSVMTEAVVPEGLQIVTADPPAMEDADAPTWTFGEMKPGESRTVKLTVLPESRGDLQMEAFVRLTGHSSTSFKVEEPMVGVAVTGPETAEVGEQVAYVVRVSNPGTGMASNVVIQAAIPEGLEHRSGSRPSIEIGTLNPGESRQAKLNLSTVKGGDYELAVRVIADGGLNDESKAAVSVAEPKLNIAIAGPEEQLAGRDAEFMLTIENTGNVQSSNVRAKYRIPEGCEFVTADRGGKYSEADHSIEWFVGTLQPEEASEFHLTLKATATGDMFHQAGVKSELGQARMCDFSSVAEGTAALDMKVVASSVRVKKGEDLTWEVRIRNTGSRVAENVGISCELPTGIQVIDAEGPSEHIAENGIMIFRSLPSIEAGDEAVYTITTKATREGTQRLRLRVASESISDPLIGEESTTVTER